MSGLLLIFLIFLAIIVRIYYVSILMVEVNISESIYNAAKVNLGVNGLASVFADGFSIQALYIYNLYLVFLLFGNFTVAGVYLNIFYQVVTVLSVYVIVRNISDKYVALAAGFIVAIVPPYIDSLAEVTMWNMEIFIVAIICAIVSFIARIIYNAYTSKRKIVRRRKPEPKIIEVVAEPEIIAVPDTSMKEIVLDDLEEKKVQYIENPLPVPKRREHKEMDFEFELTGSDDDYDLKDMTGIDFFDIE